jgi:Spy/CpxP family protein refolding chaperone
MKKTLTLAAIMLIAAGAALAQCPMGQGKGEGPKGGAMMEQGGMKDCGNPGMGMGRGQCLENPEIAKNLGLTAEQTEKIDQLSLKHRKDMVKLEADMKIARMEYQDILEGNASDGDIRKKSGEMKGLMNRLHDAKTEHMLELRKVLTADQQKKLKAEKMGMRQHMNKGAGCSEKDK